MDAAAFSRKLQRLGAGLYEIHHTPVLEGASADCVPHVQFASTVDMRLRLDLDSTAAPRGVRCGVILAYDPVQAGAGIAKEMEKHSRRAKRKVFVPTLGFRSRFHGIPDLILGRRLFRLDQSSVPGKTQSGKIKDLGQSYA